jgi:hypothetical protein
MNSSAIRLARIVIAIGLVGLARFCWCNAVARIDTSELHHYSPIKPLIEPVSDPACSAHDRPDWDRQQEEWIVRPARVDDYSRVRALPDQAE